MRNFKSYILEASLAGNSTKHKRKTANKSSGNFYQYVELNPDLKTLEIENDSFLFQMDGTPTKEVIKKGKEVEIVGREEKTLTTNAKGTLLAHIKYKRKEYRIPLSKILKPSGKQVKPIEADITNKEDPNVFANFKAGHGHESQFVQRWINSSGTLWEFEYKGKEYRITYIGAPQTKTRGNPKTDVAIELDKKIPGYGDKLYYSLKDENATYFENWILPVRFEQLFGRKSKAYIEDAYEQLNKNSKIGGSGYKSITVCSFVKSKPYNGPKLNTKQNKEALSGAVKFGRNDATANIFFAGTIPGTIEEIIDGSSTVSDMAKKADLGISFRGSNEIKNSSIFIKNDEGGWDIRENWIDFKKLKLDKDMGQSK